MAEGFELAGKTYARGSRGVARLPVTVDLDGGEVCVWVHVLVGAARTDLASAGPAARR